MGTVKLTSAAIGSTLFDFSGEDACVAGETQKTLANQIQLTWMGMNCPIKAGEQSWKMNLWMDPVIPKTLAYTTTTVFAQTHDGQELLCIEVSTEGAEDSISV